MPLEIWERAAIERKVKDREPLTTKELMSLILGSGIWDRKDVRLERDAVAIQLNELSKISITPGAITWTGGDAAIRQQVARTAMLMWGRGARLNVRAGWQMRRALRQAGFVVTNENLTARAARFLVPKATREFGRAPSPANG